MAKVTAKVYRFPGCPDELDGLRSPTTWVPVIRKDGQVFIRFTHPTPETRLAAIEACKRQWVERIPLCRRCPLAECAGRDEPVLTCPKDETTRDYRADLFSRSSDGPGIGEFIPYPWVRLATPAPVDDPSDESCPDCPLGKCVRYDPNDPRSCPWDRATGYVGDFKEGHPKRAVPAKVVPMRTRRTK